MNHPWRVGRLAGRYTVHTAPQTLPGIASPAMRRLEWATLAFLTYGVFEGLLKRLTGYAWYIYPIKDLFFLILLARWVTVLRNGAADRRPPLFSLLVGYLAIVILELLNPNLPSLVAGLAGIRASYMYAVLYFIAYRIFGSEASLRRLALLLGFLTVVTALGAIVESSLGLEWVYEHQVQVMIKAEYLGASGDWVVRPSSIGNGPGSAAMLEFIGAAFLLGLAVGERRLAFRLLLLGGAALAFGGIILSAVRIIWLQMALAAAIFVLLLGRRMIVWGLGVGVLVGSGILLGIYFSSGEITARFQTLETPVETVRVERWGAFQVLPQIISDYPYGAGVGWNVPRQDLLGSFYPEEMILYWGVHNYLSILALEVGAAGLFLFLAFSLGVLARGLKAVRRERNVARLALLAACYSVFAGIALSFFSGGAIIGWPGEYYWILAGIIMRVAQVDTKARHRLGVAMPRARFVGRPPVAGGGEGGR